MNYIKSGIINEATIQAKFYMACREAGLSCDLQHSIGTEKGRDMPDLVLVECNEIIAIVEVKDFLSYDNLTDVSKKQIERYKKHNAPLFILYSMYDIPYLVKRLVEVRKRYVEIADSVKIKNFEADRQSEKKWDEKIDTALSEFDKAFPKYRFTNEHSLELLAVGVKVLGLSDVLKLMDMCSQRSSSNFFNLLNQAVVRGKHESSQMFDKRRDGEEICTLNEYEAKLARINEKLS